MNVINTVLAWIKSDPNVINALGAFASALVAILALIISSISVFISIKTLSIQRKHNELSVRPFAEVEFGDYENSLYVKIKNNGTGPMIIDKVTFSHGANTYSTLIGQMPSLPKEGSWTTFTGELQDRMILPGREITILELTENFNKNWDFAKHRERVRAALSPLSVNINYSDIYENKLGPYHRNFSWFGRLKYESQGGNICL